MKQRLLTLWSNPLVRKPVHTFWQAFISVFGLSALGVLSNVLSTHQFSNAKSALAALVVAAVAAGLSAVKSIYITQKNASLRRAAK